MGIDSNTANDKSDKFALQNSDKVCSCDAGKVNTLCILEKLIRLVGKIRRVDNEKKDH